MGKDEHKLWEASLRPNKLRSSPGSAALRKGRISQTHAAYMVTKVVEGRRKVLTQPAVAELLLKSWNYLRSVDRIKLFAFCVMPDHYHLAFSLMPEQDLSQVMEDTNKFTSRNINRILHRQGRFWQDGFKDRNCRTVEELHELCVYIEHNPVRAGFVVQAHEWPYSSASPERRTLIDRDWWP